MRGKPAAPMLMDEMSQSRVIVIAGDKASGYAEARAQGIEPVAVVTPRSRDAARGKTADRLMDASTLTPEWRETLVPLALPAIATRRRGQPIPEKI